MAISPFLEAGCHLSAGRIATGVTELYVNFRAGNRLMTGDSETVGRGRGGLKDSAGFILLTIEGVPFQCSLLMPDHLTLQSSCDKTHPTSYWACGS